MKNVPLRKVYQNGGTPPDKLDSFGIKYTSEQKLFAGLAKFDFESICVQEETLKHSNRTTWMGRHVPISESSYSNIVNEPSLLCNSDPRPRVASLIGPLQGLALQCKTQMELLFLDIDTTIKNKLGSTCKKLNQRHNRREQPSLDDCDHLYSVVPLHS